MTDWRSLCRGGTDLVVDTDVVTVAVGDGRTQRVRVKATASTYELSSIVVRAAALDEIDDAPLRAWRRNRTSQLVGFRIDERGGLVAVGWVPTVGLTGEEFAGLVRRVAAAADLFEYQLTGKDRE